MQNSQITSFNDASFTDLKSEKNINYDQNYQPILNLN
jgi:hypothetical protein